MEAEALLFCGWPLDQRYIFAIDFFLVRLGRNFGYRIAACEFGIPEPVPSSPVLQILN